MKIIQYLNNSIYSTIQFTSRFWNTEKEKISTYPEKLVKSDELGERCVDGSVHAILIHGFTSLMNETGISSCFLIQQIDEKKILKKTVMDINYFRLDGSKERKHSNFGHWRSKRTAAKFHSYD